MRKLAAMGRTWPQYRRTVSGSNHYRIEADDRFTELQRLGKRWIIHEVRDAPYPERVRIHEMLADREGHFVPEEPLVFEGLLTEALAKGTAS